MRKIAVVTTGRSDYVIYRPILRKLAAHASVALQIIASGTHLSRKHGYTLAMIEQDGFQVAHRVKIPIAETGPESVARAVGDAIHGFGSLYAGSRPELLVVLGDRYEMHAAALAALPFLIPLAHIHGGELTRGAIDESLRHSMTKLSHLHFVATEEYGRRVRQLGEEDWRVVVSGAPSLDQLKDFSLMDSGTFESRFGFSLESSPLLVTFHPTTTELDSLHLQVKSLFGVLAGVEQSIVFTAPAPDPGADIIREAIAVFLETHEDARFVETMGPHGYFSLMSQARAMVGNSSSGIIEAPSFGLPVVNIGTRQEGRTRNPNVIDCGYSETEIRHAIDRALTPSFRAAAKRVKNRYFKGEAAAAIVNTLSSIDIDDRLIRKKFIDRGGASR